MVSKRDYREDQECVASGVLVIGQAAQKRIYASALNPREGDATKVSSTKNFFFLQKILNNFSGVSTGVSNLQELQEGG